MENLDLVSNSKYILNDVVIGKEIGDGFLGKSFLGKWKEQDVVIKKIHISFYGESTKKFLEQIEIPLNLSHPQIVQLYGCIEIKNDDRYQFGLVTKWMNMGNLFYVLQESEVLPWHVKIGIAIDIASGLSYLHSQSLLCMDLKSCDILLGKNYRAKICKFFF